MLCIFLDDLAFSFSISKMPKGQALTQFPQLEHSSPSTFIFLFYPPTTFVITIRRDNKTPAKNAQTECSFSYSLASRRRRVAET